MVHMTLLIFTKYYLKKVLNLLFHLLVTLLSLHNFCKQRYLGRKSLVQNNPAIAPRDAAIEYINLFPDKEEGRKRWKQHSSYHLRSLAETAMMRFKQTFSDKLKARTLQNQQAEVRVKCSILNKMIQIAVANSFPLPKIN